MDIDKHNGAVVTFKHAMLDQFLRSTILSSAGSPSMSARSTTVGPSCPRSRVLLQHWRKLQLLALLNQNFEVLSHIFTISNSRLYVRRVWRKQWRYLMVLGWISLITFGVSGITINLATKIKKNKTKCKPFYWWWTVRKRISTHQIFTKTIKKRT